VRHKPRHRCHGPGRDLARHAASASTRVASSGTPPAGPQRSGGKEKGSGAGPGSRQARLLAHGRSQWPGRSRASLAGVQEPRFFAKNSAATPGPKSRPAEGYARAWVAARTGMHRHERSSRSAAPGCPRTRPHRLGATLASSGGRATRPAAQREVRSRPRSRRRARTPGASLRRRRKDFDIRPRRHREKNNAGRLAACSASTSAADRQAVPRAGRIRNPACTDRRR